MRPQHPSPERRVDSDGVTHVAPTRSSSGGGVARWLVGGALVFTVLCIALSAWLSASDVAVEGEPFVEAPPPPVVEPAPVVARAPVRKPPVRQAPQGDATPVMGEPTAPPEPATEPDVPSSGPTGIQLYRPGTKPLKRGLVVPEGFELPPGYVRHYQSTDEGERVEAILMFHPDHQPVDANGQPLEIPENRVVPAELAPPGMPVRMLELPKSDESKDSP
ncbi:hypothetical protein [Myxococcus qinghaiensis]|uniref:hypothetical protein n=1 Tax=Myxococcus qinghaiensis TaxID=2906758 RepID=UPI0020A7A70F|nr:hypothetical protein [Myxococcus qinghaiensis]MCP3166165.1 hypothetical protein [Myxococcus qinghaiensis]